MIEDYVAFQKHRFFWTYEEDVANGMTQLCDVAKMDQTSLWNIISNSAIKID